MGHVDPAVWKIFTVLKAFHPVEVLVGVRKEHVQPIEAAFASVAKLSREFQVRRFMDGSIQAFDLEIMGGHSGVDSEIWLELPKKARAVEG